MGKWAGLLAVAVAVGANACTVKADDSSRFRDPIPQGGDVAMAVPGSSTGSATKAQSTGLRLMDTPGATSYAEYYQATRDLTDSVDTGTASVLGLVWMIVNLPPTSLGPHTAVWGPGADDALSPVVWRMTVNEVGDHEYDYTLEGRPKASTSEADYKAILTGHGFGKERIEHRQGWFKVDNDVSHALDPAKNHDSGNLKITYDLRQLPETINVDLVTTDKPANGTILVTHEAGGAGAVDITTHHAADATAGINADDLVLHSRWDQTGAGRGDAQYAGGTLPPTIPSVQASECWNTAFARVYYKDSQNWKPESGNPASCVFAQAKF